MWQTAKELKWDQYLQLNMFEWALLSSVDRKVHVIYNTVGLQNQAQFRHHIQEAQSAVVLEGHINGQRRVQVACRNSANVIVPSHHGTEGWLLEGFQ